MDRRQKKTRTAIYHAFADLLAKRSYSNITVQEIIDEADIGRSTFYSHFETKDELLNSLCTEIFEHVFAPVLQKESTHDFSAAEYSLEEELIHILYHLRDNSRYIRPILSCESGEIFMRFFKEHLTPVFDQELKKIEIAVPMDYMLNHMVSDFAETVRWWMHHENYTPEEIGRFFFYTTPFSDQIR